MNTVFQGGLEVHTTFDPVAQAFAENAMAVELPSNNLGIIGALVSVEPGTGAVRAMIGGPGFDQFQFNVTTQKGRPTGSSFKPFVLAAAFELSSLVPQDSINATSPCQFDNPGGLPNPYVAGDYNGGRRSGSLSIEEHTLRSTNCGFIRLANLVGSNNVVDTAQALGITNSTIEATPALPLGPYDITPLEMANAYATIANDGVRVDPHLISRVTRGNELVFEHDPSPFRAVKPQTARLVTSVLEKNVSCPGVCTARRAQLDNHPAAGKTGTGQDNFDAWFVGYTAQLATAVWMGGQDAQISMRYDWRDPSQNRADYVEAFGQFADTGVTGGSMPSIIWGRFMNSYMASLPVVDFLEPERGRNGERLAVEVDEEPEVVRVSPCGSVNAEVDQDGDGDVDWCRNLGGTPITSSGCAALLVAVDQDGDGTNDRCVARIRPPDAIDPNAPVTTTTVDPDATTTVAPATTVDPAVTTVASTTTATPATTVAPATTAAAPTTTATPTTTVAPATTAAAPTTTTTPVVP